MWQKLRRSPSLVTGAEADFWTSSPRQPFCSSLDVSLFSPFSDFPLFLSSPPEVSCSKDSMVTSEEAVDSGEEEVSASSPLATSWGDSGVTEPPWDDAGVLALDDPLFKDAAAKGLEAFPWLAAVLDLEFPRFALANSSWQGGKGTWMRDRRNFLHL